MPATGPARDHYSDMETLKFFRSRVAVPGKKTPGSFPAVRLELIVKHRHGNSRRHSPQNWWHSRHHKNIWGAIVGRRGTQRQLLDGAFLANNQRTAGLKSPAELRFEIGDWRRIMSCSTFIFPLLAALLAESLTP